MPSNGLPLSGQRFGIRAIDASWIVEARESHGVSSPPPWRRKLMKAPTSVALPNPVARNVYTRNSRKAL